MNVCSSWRIRVSEIAGGTHSAGSTHYQGKAFDLDRVDGVQINAANAGKLVDRCRSLGARYTAFENGNHVHCDFS